MARPNLSFKKKKFTLVCYHILLPCVGTFPPWLDHNFLIIKTLSLPPWPNVYGIKDLTQTSTEEDSAAIRERVTRARFFQLKRFGSQGRVTCNARMTSRQLRKYCALDQQSIELPGPTQSCSLSLGNTRIVTNQNAPKTPKICQYLSMTGSMA